MRMKTGIFITGTDTGVGKTIVSATLARYMRMNGVNVGVMKPATSGCRLENGHPVSDDALLLCNAAGVPCDAIAAPYLLREPLAPAEAARLDGVEISFAHIRDCYRLLAERHDFVIVEGAGGLLVPMSGMRTVADLALEIGLPLLVVARPNLGTINHTALTCLTAERIGLEVAGVIINNYPDSPGLAETSAAEYIKGLCNPPLLEVWPHHGGSNDAATIEFLAGWLNARPDSATLLKQLGSFN